MPAHGYRKICLFRLSFFQRVRDGFFVLGFQMYWKGFFTYSGSNDMGEVVWYDQRPIFLLMQGINGFTLGGKCVFTHGLLWLLYHF